MATREAWVVKTPDGFLGLRRYNYSNGGTSGNPKAAFKFARVFSRQCDAERSLRPGDEVVPVTISTKQL